MGSEKGVNQTRWHIALRLRAFGDVLATLEALRALRESAPDVRIVYVVDAAFHPLLRDVAYIDGLVVSPPRVRTPADVLHYLRYVRSLRALRPQAILDFHGSARTALLAMLIGAHRRIGYELRGRRIAYTDVVRRAWFDADGIRRRNAVASACALLEPLGIPLERTGHAMAPLGVSEASLKHAREQMVSAGVPVAALDDGRVIALNPGRAYPAKEWGADRFASLASRLADQGFHSVVMWGPGEESAAQSIVTDAGSSRVHLAPASSLADLPGLLGCMRALVTIDSGLKHLAVCAGVPTLSLFGSTHPDEWHVGGARDTVLWKGLSCSPCRRTECPYGTPCMAFGVSEVERELNALLETV